MDYTAALMLSQVITQLHRRGVRVVVSSLVDPVREQLGRYGISGAAGPDAYFDTPGEALESFRR